MNSLTTFLMGAIVGALAVILLRQLQDRLSRRKQSKISNSPESKDDPACEEQPSSKEEQSLESPEQTKEEVKDEEQNSPTVN